VQQHRVQREDAQLPREIVPPQAAPREHAVKPSWMLPS
jgi:hypothetical protein